MKILIPETVCKALDRLEPETRQILLGYIYDYRVSNIAPYIGEDGEVIRFAWPLIVTEFARLDSQRQRQQKSRAHKRSVTVTQELPPSPEREKSPHTPLKEKATSSSKKLLIKRCLICGLTIFGRRIRGRSGSVPPRRNFARFSASRKNRLRSLRK